MQLSAILLAALASSSLAITPIAIGYQYRVSTINYNIAYVEGKDPCKEDVAISLLGKERCNRPFRLAGATYELKNCGKSNWQILRNGKFAGDCKAIKDKKVHCGGSTHDVIKTAICA
ncbi:hypothetical protein BJ878DRAFT_500356 [Calycina marina]|uniref:Uncharacterized protein n=1 Tax=Calycina marina TaxID=1763456 RepID=A0A9P7Z4Y4_9HELO|nr:hypothetical protein BJ878DRAFT_500356 [Calycina marina]